MNDMKDEQNLYMLYVKFIIQVAYSKNNHQKDAT